MDERVKRVAIEEAESIKAQAIDAVQSEAYLYPIKGIFYFLSHRELWRPLMSKLVPTITLGVGVTTAFFVLFYLPQAALMAFTSGPVAAVSAALLTLSESSTVTNLLSKTFFIEGALIDTFDGVLLSKDCTNLVSGGRQIKAGHDSIARLGKLMSQPFAKFSPNALIRYVLFLPLNFIPVIGTVVFVLLQGRRNGPSAHQRYFQLKEWSARQRDIHIEQNQGGYTAFGLVAFLLELVPFANFFFAFTNATGAALWAADMEKSATTAPKLRESAKKAA